jgi:hypothetical protein
MKNYYIRAEICEGYPDYEFVIKANSLDIAISKANKILKADYPEEYRKDNFYCTHITAEELLERMTLLV